MAQKRIAIPIARFQADRPLACDVFLNLPLNNKSLCVSRANGSLSAEQISRFSEKGVTHLEIDWLEAFGEDVDLYPLFLEENLQAISASAEGASPLVVASNEVDSPKSSRKNAEPDSDLENIRVEGQTEESFGGTSLRQDNESFGETAFKAVRGDTVDENSISSTQSVDDRSKIKASKEETDRARLVKGKFDSEETKQSISGDQPDDELVRKVTPGQENEEIKLFRVTTGDKELESSVVFRLEKRLEEAKEMLLSGKPFTVSSQTDEILKEAKSSLLASKISERIVAISGNENASFELPTLTADLKIADSSEAPSPEILEKYQVTKEIKALEVLIASDSPESEKVLALSDKLNAFAKNRSEAQQVIEEEEKRIAAGSGRDKMMPISRLATSLAYSLGYTHPQYLRDIAIAATYHLAIGPSSDANPVKDDYPTLLKVVMGQELARSSSEEDGLEIIGFLGSYLKEPNIDLSTGDFSRRAFEKTISTTRQSASVEQWNLLCWEKLNALGLSMEAYNACSRAAALAIKYAKQNNAEL